jgi:hypothetical protein
MGAPVHSPEDVERGLAALVIAGSSIRASEVTGINDSTLREWKLKHAERYEQLRHELEPQVARTIAAEAEHLTQRVFAIEHKILDTFTDEEIDQLKPADKASALRNLQTVAALGIDKLSSPLRERPSHVQHGTSPDELVARMARALGFDATSTAIEVPNHALEGGQ